MKTALIYLLGAVTASAWWSLAWWGLAVSNGLLGFVAGSLTVLTIICAVWMAMEENQ